MTNLIQSLLAQQEQQQQQLAQVKATSKNKNSNKMALTCAFTDSLSLYDNDNLVTSILDTDFPGDTKAVWPSFSGFHEYNDVFETKDDLMLTTTLPSATPLKQTKQGKKNSSKPKKNTTLKKERKKASKPKLMTKKRKSLDWDAKPLEKRHQPHLKLCNEPLPFIDAPFEFHGLDDQIPSSVPMPGKRGSVWEDELAMLSEFFPTEKPKVKTNIPKNRKPLQKRTSESWHSKPGKYEMKDITTCLPQLDLPTSPTKTKKKMSKIDPNKRKRLKWSKDENAKLWTGIYKYGNNWTEVKKTLTTRSYDQIKDKGRRLLFVQGWKTGRNKKNSDEAMNSAKSIAHTVLKAMSQI